MGYWIPVDLNNFLHHCKKFSLTLDAIFCWIETNIILGGSNSFIRQKHIGSKYTGCIFLLDSRNKSRFGWKKILYLTETHWKQIYWMQFLLDKNKSYFWWKQKNCSGRNIFESNIIFDINSIVILWKHSLFSNGEAMRDGRTILFFKILVGGSKGDNRAVHVLSWSSYCQENLMLAY